MESASLTGVVTGHNPSEPEKKNFQREESFLSARPGILATHHVTGTHAGNIMRSPLSVSGTHTLPTETSVAVSVGIPSQYSQMAHDNEGKAWRFEQMLHGMHLLKNPRSPYPPGQLNTAISAVSSGVGDVELSVTGVLPSQVAPHQAQPVVHSCAALLPSQFTSRRGPLSKTSPYRGVSCYKRTGRWEAHIWHAGKQVHLGTYSTPAEAARVYDMAAIRLRGWGAELNFNLSAYKDDPELQDLPCLPGSNPEAIDVAKLVQGLKRRKESGCQTVVTPEATKVDLSPDGKAVQATEFVGHQRPARDSPGLMEFPVHSGGNLYCHRGRGNSVIEIPESQPHIGSPVEVYVDGSSTQIGRSLWSPGSKHTCKPQLLVGSMPVPACEPVIQSAAVHSSGIPVLWKQDRSTFEKSILLNSAPVAPSRVISVGRYPSVQPPQLQHGVYHCGDINGQLLWGPELPTASNLNVVVKKPVIPTEEYILEGKPLSQGHEGASPIIPAFWHRVDDFGTCIPARDPVVHTTPLSTSLASSVIERGGLGKPIGGTSILSSSAPPLNGPLQSLTSVLQEAVQGQENRDDSKLPTVASSLSTERQTKAFDQPGSGSESQQIGSGALDSTERFANLIRLIQELPTKHLVRPSSEADNRTDSISKHQVVGTGMNCVEAKNGKLPFEGDQKLRPGSSHRSAFKTWTSSDSDKGKNQNGDDVPSHQDIGSEHSTGVVSDLNNIQASNQCESCSADGASENAHKIVIGNAVEETDEIAPSSTSGSVPSGSQASGAGNNQMMDDDLLAAQELYKMSKMRGSGSSNGSIGFSCQSRKRPHTSQVTSPPDTFPSWQKKKLRSMSTRGDAKQAVPGIESRGFVDKQAENTEHVLGNSGQANMCITEGISQRIADIEDEGFAGPGKIDSGVSASCACGGKALRKAGQQGDWPSPYGSLIAE